MPRQMGQDLFGTGELTRGCLNALRGARRPLTGREIAQTVLSVLGPFAGDRRLMTEHTKRVSNALRKLKIEGVVRSVKEPRAGIVWELRHDS